MRYIYLFACAMYILMSCQSKTNDQGAAYKDGKLDSVNEESLVYPEEKHLKNIRQLTFGGDNAEAYWSFDDQRLIFQSNNEDWGVSCDQIFLHNLGEKQSHLKPPMLSTGKGRTTCAYFMPGNKSVLYASTHLADNDCPLEPDHDSGKYVWPLYDSYDIFESDLNGRIIKRLTSEPGYDAEATVSPKGDKIVFTSTRSGDLELYTMDIDGSNVNQVTHDLGYDGGAFFSPDGTKLVWRSSRPTTPEEIKEYKDLLADGLVQPTNMELYVGNVDGTDIRKVTDLGNANWAPFFHPSGDKILFASNHKSKRGFPFNLFLINVDGTGLEQVTYDKTFDSFPMFSNDGRQLVFASNRFNGGNRDTNLFLADWVD